MSLPVTFGGLTNPTLGELDQNFAAVGALTTIPCTISGTNVLALTPLANSPTVTAYADYQGYSGVAVSTSTGPTAASVGSLPILPVYKDLPTGPTLTTGGEIGQNNLIILVYDKALNSGNGGFHLQTFLLRSNPARTQTTPGAPTAPASTSVFAMQGLAAVITPVRSGAVLMIVSGTIVSPSGTTAGLGILYQISYGTGAAPANAAALTGTQVGPVQEYTNAGTVTAADVKVPFSIQYYVSGLTLGTAYWVDISAKSVGTASDMGLANISVSLVEI